MTKYTGRLVAPIAVGALAFLAACGGDKGKADSALATDTTLNRDLALAGRDTAAQPALTDVPNAASKTTAKAPTGTKSKTPATKTASGNTKTAGTGTAAKTGMIAAGTALNL